MFSFLWIRKAIRVGFLSTILAGVLLGALMLQAHAAPLNSVKPQTQLDDTSSGGGGRSGSRSTSNVSAAPIADDHLISDFTAEVGKRLQVYDGQYVSGREAEVETLNDNFDIAEGRTVIAQGEGGSGRTALLEEYLRTHPQDRAWRLDTAALAQLSDDEAGKALNSIILKLEQENIKAAGSHRVILFVDNLAALQRAKFPEPIQAIWQHVVRKANLYFFLESDAPTAKSQLNPELSRFKNIAGLVKVQNILPAKYDDVLDYLVRTRASYEALGVSVSHLAYEEAARLAIRFHIADPFRMSDLLIKYAIQLVKTEQQNGISTAEKTKMDIKKLKNSISILSQDLEHETDPGVKAAIQTKLVGFMKELNSKQGDLAILNIPNSKRQELAKVEFDLVDENAALDHEKASKSLFNGSQIAKINARIRELQTKKLALEAEINGSEPTGGRPATRVGEKQIRVIEAKWQNVRPERLQANFDEGIRRIQEIKLEVFGQDYAIDELQNSLIINHTKLREGGKITSPEQAQRIRQGLENDSVRPIGSFWFAGPTGVGKSETAEQMADKLGYKPIIFDMSEYQQEHETSKLIGAPPGFKGMDTPGALTEAVRLNPQSVLIFDEIEKAHPDVLKFMLQVLDKGRMTDNQGRVIDFRQCVIIFTSNLAQDIGRWSDQEAVDFLRNTAKYSDEMIENLIKGEADPSAALKRETYRAYVTNKDIAREKGFNAIPSEIFARIDKIIQFNTLSKENAMRIAEKTVKNFVLRLKALYDVDLRFSPQALAQYIGYFNDREGGRSMRRGFDKIFRAPVARLVFEQRATAGETILLDVDQNHMLEWKTSTPAEIAEAETKSVNDPDPVHPPAAKEDLADAEQLLLFPEEKVAKAQAARAATGELMRKVFSPEWLISERAFRWIRR